MLQNAYLFAKIGADTAENEQHLSEILPKIGNYPQCSHADEDKDLRDLFRDPALRTAGSARGAPDGAAPAASKMHFSKILQIFGGLVLGCIKTKFCKKTCVRQHFSSSTRFASFCTAAISKFSQKIGLKNQQFS